MIAEHLCAVENARLPRRRRHEQFVHRFRPFHVIIAAVDPLCQRDVEHKGSFLRRSARQRHLRQGHVDAVKTHFLFQIEVQLRTVVVAVDAAVEPDRILRHLFCRRDGDRVAVIRMRRDISRAVRRKSARHGQRFRRTFTRLVIVGFRRFAHAAARIVGIGALFAHILGEAVAVRILAALRNFVHEIADHILRGQHRHDVIRRFGDLQDEIIRQFGGKVQAEGRLQIDVAVAEHVALFIRFEIAHRHADGTGRARSRARLQIKIRVGVRRGGNIADLVERDERADARADISARRRSIARKSDPREQDAHGEQVTKIGNDGNFDDLFLTHRSFSSLSPKSGPWRPKARLLRRKRRAGLRGSAKNGQRRPRRAGHTPPCRPRRSAER